MTTVFAYAFALVFLTEARYTARRMRNVGDNEGGWTSYTEEDTAASAVYSCPMRRRRLTGWSEVWTEYLQFKGILHSDVCCTDKDDSGGRGVRGHVLQVRCGPKTTTMKAARPARHRIWVVRRRPAGHWANLASKSPRRSTLSARTPPHRPLGQN